MKTLFRILGACLLAAALYLAFWPVPVAPVAWSAAPDAGYVGPHARNERLAQLTAIPIGDNAGPEHLAFGPDGKLYAAVASGDILRMGPNGEGREVFVNTGGRVLGFDFDREGRLIAADANRGLLAIAPDRSVAVLADKVGDDPIRFANAIVVAKSGLIYFSDASRRFGAKDWGGTFEASILDIMEQQSTGRVLVYDPATKTTKIVASGFSFANGVALSADETGLFVNETGKYRVWRVPTAARDLDVSKDGAAKVVLDNLPGYPDNLMRGQPTADGRPTVWVGLAKPRNALVDKLAAWPAVRAMIIRLPRALWPVPPAYGHVIAFAETGAVVADLQDPSGAYPETTGVTESKDRLYIQSLHAHSIGWMARPK